MPAAACHSDMVNKIHSKPTYDQTTVYTVIDNADHYKGRTWMNANVPFMVYLKDDAVVRLRVRISVIIEC